MNLDLFTALPYAPKVRRCEGVHAPLHQRLYVRCNCCVLFVFV